MSQTMNTHRKPILFLSLLLLLSFSPTFLVSKQTTTTHPHFPCKPPHFNTYPFCNTSLSPTHRAHSLISLLTLQEKTQHLATTTPSIPRLGLPPYEWWSESLHGIATNGPGISFSGGPISFATSFPQVIVTTASFNRTLWFDIGSAVAVEARAMYNVGQAGLTYWAPNINIYRDPRWGRGQETSGEDPLVASDYGVEFVRGFEGGKKRRVIVKSGDGFSGKRVLIKNTDDDDRIMLSACCKHFTAYDLDKWGNFSRYSFDAKVTEQDMEDTYQPPFRSCIQQGKASCLMCSYNAVNGVPACARGDLLQKARDEWGFKGYITSDCDAVGTVFEYQKYTNSAEDAVADVLKAGVDINCGTFLLRNTKSSIDQGKVQEEDVDRALLNLFLVQLRLGLYDGDPTKGRFGKLGPKDVCTLEHRTLALEAARQGMVLLKNDQKFLPLKKNARSSLVIIGPMANNVSNMGGGYTGYPCNPKSLFDRLKPYVKKISYASGCPDVSCESNAQFNEAVATAKQADYVIVVAGLDLSQETEDHDRVSLLLPGKQRNLVSSVAAASKRPVILVLTGGGPLDVTFAKADPRIASIIWIGYPGEAGGQALAQIIFGDFNPGGRLPMTWYPESFTKVPMNDMNMRSDPSRDYPGRTYRFYTGNPVYDFGHGLSYTNFTHKFVSAPNKLFLSGLLEVQENQDFVHIDKVKSCDSLTFHARISISNVGDMDGSHVVMLFARVPKVCKGTPEKQLIGFERVHVVSYGLMETSILVEPCKHFSFSNEYGERILPVGRYALMLGDLEHFVSVEI